MKRLTLYNIFKKNPKLFISGIFGLILVTVFLFVSVQSAIFLFLIVSEIILALVLGFFHLNKFGFELVTVTAVMGGVVYGPTTGLSLGIILSIFHYLLSQSFGPYIFYSIPIFGAMGFLAGMFLGVNIVFLGIAISLVYNSITTSLGVLSTGNIAGELLWSGSNLAVNFILFTQLVPLLI